jgi:uncharacterized membrane protein YeaQ/YmgE (transglycosylase-associated protein family)
VPLWLHWIVLGLFAGALAKYLMPGRDPSGCIVTTVLGMLGASIGGLIGTRLGWGRVTAARFEPRSLALATLGAVVILAAGRLVKGLMVGGHRRHRADALLWQGDAREREPRE